MPKYIPLTYEQMDEYLDELAVNSDLYPGSSSAYGMTKKQALAQAKEEKETLPEKDWSISTLLTEWDGMYRNHRQLKEPDTFSTDSGVMGKISALASYTRNFYPTLADNIFGGKSLNVGKHNGFLYLYGMMAGIKEEKWAEMPEFAHYAKVLLRKCNLPLPVPRKDVPTRADAERNYIDAIDVNQQPKKNLDAMLGILAVHQKFREGEALYPYEDHPSSEKKNQKLKEMFTVDAHPILTAATVFELRQNKDLMAFLDTPEAVKAAKEGTLPQLANERVFDPEAGAKAKAAQEEAERQRLEQKKQQAAEEKANRGRAVQDKRREDLRKMLTRLGVTDADLTKKPDELKLSGSTEYNNMARAALQAYQSASGSDAYDIDLDEKVRQACFAYTKGKKSVRFFESGRKRFDTCLELMMSVSEPNEKGEFPAGIQAQFDRINEVRKTKHGDRYYVSPKYYKYDKNQLTVREAMNGLGNNPRLFTDGKLDWGKWGFVKDPLMAAMPKLPNGKPDPDAIVDGKTFQDCFDPDRAKKPDLLKQLLDDYDEKKRLEQKKQEEAVLADKNEEQRICDEWTEFRGMSVEQQEDYLKAHADQLDKVKADLEKARTLLDPRHAVTDSKTDGQYNFKEALKAGLAQRLEEKQAEANDRANNEYHSEEQCSARKRLFEAKQQELSEAWKGFHSLKYLDEFDNYYRNMRQYHGNQSCIDEFRKALGNAAELKNELSTLKADIEKRKQTAEDEKGKQTDKGEKAALEKMEKKALDLQKEAEKWACRAYACSKLFKPDEKVQQSPLTEMTTRLFEIPEMGSKLLDSIVQAKVPVTTVSQINTITLWRTKSNSFQKAQELFDARIPDAIARASDVYVPAATQTINAEDTYKTLEKLYHGAMEKYTGEKEKFENTEKERKQQFEKDKLPYIKGEIPSSLHKARDFAVRLRVAGYLVPKMYEDRNAAPDLADLNYKANQVLENGDYMSRIVHQDINAELEAQLKVRSEALIKYNDPNKAVEPPKSVDMEAQKQVNNNTKAKVDPKKDNKKNNNKKSGMGLG